MKKILQSNYTAFYEDFNIPNVANDEILIKTHYSFISTGTESVNFKNPFKKESFSDDSDEELKKQYLEKSKLVLQLAKKAIKNPKKAIYYSIDKIGNIFDQKKLKNKETTIEERNEIIEKNFKYGFPLGYSAVGEIIDKGKDIKNLNLGDIVSCSGAEFANHGEYILVKKNFCVKIPKNCPVDLASTTTLGSIAMNSIRRANPQIGDNIGIVGFGLLGNITYEIIKNTSANIFCFDINNEKFSKYDNTSSSFFTSDWDEYENKIEKFTNQHGLDKIIIAAADKKNKLIDNCLKILRKKGKLIILGDVLFNFERSEIYKKEIDLLISTSYGPGRYDKNYENKSLDYPYHYVRWTFNRNMDSYIKLIDQKKIDLDSIIQKRIKFSELADFYNNKDFENYKGVLVEYSKEHEPKNKIIKKFKNKIISDNKTFVHCGLGAYSQSTLIPLFKEMNYSPESVVTSNHLNSTNFLNENKISNVYPNLKNFFSGNDKNVAFAVIANKHNEHASYILECIDKKKHVFIEKPIAINSYDLEIIEDKINSSDNLPILHVNFNRRFSEHGIKLRQILLNMNSQCYLNYNIFSNKINDDHWQNDPKIGGGRNLGETIHMYDFCKFIISEKIFSINAVSFNNNSNSINENKQNFSVNLKFVNGSIANINYFTCASDSEPKETIELRCQKKTFILENFRNLIELNNDEKKIIYKTKEVDKGHKNSIKYFLDCIEGKEIYDNSKIISDIETTKLALMVESQIS